MPESTSPLPGSSPKVYLPIGVLSVLFGGMLSTLNGRLLTVALPDIRGALHLSIEQGAWVSTSFNMAIMFIGVFSVYLGALLGARRVLLFSSAVYVTACLLLPLSSGYPAMLVLEVIAGLTCGTFYPLTLSFILNSLPPRIAHIGFAAYSLTILFSANIASALSGWVMNVFSWSCIFLTLACLAVLMFFCVRYGIPRTSLPKSNPKVHISWRGLLYWSFGLALLYGALDIGERVRWFDSRMYAGLVIAGSFLVVMSFVRRRQDPNPLISIPFLRNRSTLLLACVLFCFRLFLLCTAFLIPQFLTGVKGLRDEQVGPVLAVTAVLQFGIAWIVAYSLREVNVRLLMSIGFGLIGITALLCSHLNAEWAPINFVPYEFLFGIGESFAMLGMVGAIVLQVIGTGVVPAPGNPGRPADVITFSGFFHTVRIMGGQVATVFMAHALAERTKFHNAILSQATSPDRLPISAFVHATSSAFGFSNPDLMRAAGLSGYLLGASTRKQASTLAFADEFTIIAWASLAVLLVIFFVRLKITSFKRFV